MKAVQLAQLHRLSPLASAVSLALLAPVCMAQAQQEPSAQAAAAPSDPAGLTTVVVTANKRKEKLMDVPAAISVLDSATLDRANVKGMDDLPALSPALTITYSTQPANYSINMRGIGTFSLGIGVESDVAIIIDDIPIALQAGAFKDLADVSRVEVLKGPQSTLFGKSAIAGALNIATRSIAAERKTTASVLVTNDGEHRLSASISGAIDDHFRARLAGSSTEYDGPVKNLTSNTHLNGNRGQTLLSKLEWTPTDDLTFTLSPHYNHSVVSCCVQPYTSMTNEASAKYTLSGLTTPATPQMASTLLGGIDIAKGNVSVRNDYPAGGVSHDYGTGVKVDYAPESGSALSGYTLSSITSIDRYHLNDYQDGDATDDPVAQYLVPTGNYTTGLYQYGGFDVKSFTQEFRLTSPEKQRLRYVAGLWFGKNNLARWLIRGPIQPYSTDYDSTAYNTNYAVFGDGSLDLTPDTSLIGGLRLNREATGYTFTKYANPPAAATVTGVWAKNDVENSKTGRIGLQHRLDKDTMFYGTYSTGHKGVAYDLTSSFSATTAANQPVPSENAHSIELGTKATFLNNRAAISVDIYRTNFHGFQQSASEKDETTGAFITQLHSIGQLQTKGLEVDGSFRATSNLLLTGNLAWMKATIIDFPNGTCYTVLNAAGTTAVNGGNCALNAAYGTGYFQNLAGKTLPNAPRFKANLGGQYDIPLASQSFDMFVTGAYRWQSSTQFNINQDPGTIQSAYGILDGGVGAKSKSGNYTVSFFAKNLLNKLYAAGLVNTPRNSTWSTSTANVSTTQWTPPRDYTRYFGVRLDLSY